LNWASQKNSPIHANQYFDLTTGQASSATFTSFGCN
jgi:hypothetical protein